MAVILLKRYEMMHDGNKDSGPLLAGPEGLSIGVQRVEKVSLLKKRTTTGPGYTIVRWDDVTAYEISSPTRQQTIAFGSTWGTSTVTVLTLKTASNQHSFELPTTETVLRNQLGTYLASIDARLRGAS